MRRHAPLLALVLCGTPLAASAQVPAAAGDAAGSGTAATDAATELDPVRVLGRRPPRDPFAFDNPVEAEDTVFSRDWDEAPGLEEVGMRGGYVQMAIEMGIMATAKAIRRLPGYQDQIVGARARPPPLDAEQAERARRLYEGTDAPR